MTDNRIDSSLIAAPNGQRGRPEQAAIGLVVVAFGLVMGLPGIVAGLATAAVWYRLGTPYAIAVGHILLVSLGPGSIDPVSVVLVGAAMSGLLVAPAIRTAAPIRLLGSTVLAVIVLATIAWFVSRSQPLWIAGSVTLGAIALASYGCYRYTLVAFELIDEPTTTPTREIDEH